MLFGQNIALARKGGEMMEVLLRLQIRGRRVCHSRLPFALISSFFHFPSPINLNNSPGLITQISCNKHGQTREAASIALRTRRPPVRPALRPLRPLRPLALPSTLQRMSILQQRVHLLSSLQDYSPTRLGNLQRLLKHYSSNIFRPGVKYDFDQIKYNNEHLIVERFLAFVKDFKLNIITVNGEDKYIVDPKHIALLFKTSSKDSRNVDIGEFIMLLERLFVMMFDETQDYARKQRMAKKERREKRREARQREIQRLEKIQARFGPQIALKQGSNGGAKKAVSPQKKKPQPSSLKKKTQPQEDHPDEVIIDESDVLYHITDEQKIESYMLRIGIDDRKEMEKKLRSFTKADYKYYEVEDLERFKPSKREEGRPVEEEVGKKEESQQRLEQVKQKVMRRELAKNRHLLSKSLSKDGKKSTMRKNSLNELALAKAQVDNGLHYSLQMLSHSSPGQLPHKIHPPAHFPSPSHDPTDQIYLREFGLTSRHDRSISRSNAEMIKRTKQLAHQLQTQQARHLSRYTNNLLPNHQYLQKFMERRW